MHSRGRGRYGRGSKGNIHFPLIRRAPRNLLDTNYPSNSYPLSISRTVSYVPDTCHIPSHNPKAAKTEYLKDHSQRIYPIGIKILENLLEREPYIIPLELLKKKSGYDVFLKDNNVRDTKMSLVLKLLHKSLDSRANSNGVRELLLLTMNNAVFIQNLQKYISSIKYEVDKAKEYLPLVGALISGFLAFVPLVAFSIVSPLADLCIGIVQSLRITDGSDSVKELLSIFSNIQVELVECRNKWIKSKRVMQITDSGPPDDITDHMPYPTVDELNANGKPYIRPLITKGAYEDSKHYIDIHFRVLKEDFVRPLRKGLRHYRSKLPTKNLDVRIYANVNVYDSGVDKSEFVYFLKLNTSRNLDLENSKLLMFGNVLCISSDNFETLVIGSVFNRDKINKNIIGIKLELENTSLLSNVFYTVIESKAYFVSYKHTLRALQNIQQVPLYDYLVKSNEVNSPPTYVRRETIYEIFLKNNDLCRTEDSLDEVKTVRLLDDIKFWPSCFEQGLDESQRCALYGALTRKMAIIQGPPGTGKTFIGLKITEILLTNKIKWSEMGTKPILVVCYTNHALDQFLEGILSFTTNIVRIGCQSKTPKLEEYQIKKLLRKNREMYTKRHAQWNCKSDDYSISQKYYEIRGQLRDAKKDIDTISWRLKSLNKPGILNLRSILNTFPSIIPMSCSRQLLHISLKDYLIEQFSVKQEIKKLSKYKIDANFQFEDSTPLSREVSAYEEIRRDEERDRKLHGDDNDSEDDADDDTKEDNNIANSNNASELINMNYHCQNIPYFKWETTQLGIEDKIAALKQAKIKLKLKNLCTKQIKKQIKMLELELRTLRACKRITGSDAECRNLETIPLLELGFQNRWKLYNFWKKKIIIKLEDLKKECVRKLMKIEKSMESVEDLASLNLMKKVDIVGITTTGAARYCHLFHDLGPPIVIVEEAAEILEAHVVSALSTKCQHLILIGDHLQLRPKPNVYELEIKYNLGTSLFERMIKNNIRFETLEYQHRMKPIFSNLLVPTIYENLKDHPSVFNFPKIRGLEKDLFFLDHNQFENKPHNDNESFENLYEAEFLMRLCQHLRLQGYSPDDITILTPYSGQFRCFKKLQRSTQFSLCLEVRISILDNYQGEECKIILLSLVRSNPEENVGFVKTENRICVALSRARHGMYIIGNMAQMVNSSSLWEKINEKLINGGNIGSELELTCENHSDVHFKVKCLNDFVKGSPQGGCTGPCSNDLLHCGHKCTQYCHVIDMNHQHFRCKQPCDRLCERGHACKKLCFEMCNSCPVKVEKTLPCSHKHMIECGIQEEGFECPTKLERTIPNCMHVETLECHIDVSKFQCRKPCTIRLDCGHKCKMICHVTDDPDHEKYNCNELCEKTPGGCEFQHRCNMKCHEICGECPKIIDRKLKCGHMIKKIKCSISEKDITCYFRCKRSLACGHYCPQKCGETCGGCTIMVEKTVEECSHKIKVRCSETPTIRICSGDCVKMLPCGHLCVNTCRMSCIRDCQMMVPSGTNCPRGHSLMVPCHIVQKRTSWDNSPTSLKEKPIGEYCIETCGSILSCDHPCQGKCGECFNGRLHVGCKMPCNKALVCGHFCKAPCSADCPPCQESCPWKCLHSACKKKCGITCVNCKEKCIRKCPHSTCTRKCGDKCNRAPCKYPCPLKIKKCGHPCIGYCGEPCPLLCRICNQSDVTTLIFGNEDDPDARFILLEDCGHVVESTGLEKWVDTSLSVNAVSIEIEMKKCPLCKAPIYNNRRFYTEVLEAYKNVVEIKNKHFSSKCKFAVDTFIKKLIELFYIWPYHVSTLRRNLGYDRHFAQLKKKTLISDQQTTLYSFQIKFLDAAKTVLTKFMGKDSSRLRYVVNEVMKYNKSITNQGMDEFNCELRRLETSISVEELRAIAIGNVEVQKIIEAIDTTMHPSVKYVSESESKVIELLKMSEKFIGSLRITERERSEIVNAMGMRQGHWYKCSNGHIYCITECGGADEEAKCPDCDATIGGSGHKLRGDNKLATEMDGALNPAWPTALL